MTLPRDFFRQARKSARRRSIATSTSRRLARLCPVGISALAVAYAQLKDPAGVRRDLFGVSLKNSVMNNVFFHTRQEIQETVSKFVKWVNTVPLQVINRLCA